MNKVQEALQSAIDAMIMYQLKLDSTFIDEAIISCKSALSDIENSEVVAWQHREYPEKIYQNLGAFSSEYGNVHEAQPLFTSPQPIEKCEPVAWLVEPTFLAHRLAVSEIVRFKPVEKPDWIVTPLYTSPISKEWVGLSDQQIQNLIINSDNYNKFQFIKSVEHTVKQLNAEKG